MAKAPDLPSGTSIRLVLSRCDCPETYLTSHEVVLPLLAEAVRACEMTPLSQTGHDFTGAGHSTCLILAESHVTIHTYPECSRTAVVELTVCDHQRPNRERAQRLARQLVQIFRPGRYVEELTEMVPRGEWREG
jgi:S-adenosylmethionine decarboxylase